MRNQRVAEVHHQGAAVDAEQQEISYFDYLQRTEWKGFGVSTDRSFFFGPIDMEVARSMPVTIDILMMGGEKVAERCARYLSLLEQMVQAYLAAHPT